MNRDVLFSSASEEWETPPSFFAALDAEFNFTLDAAATPSNAKCAKFFTLNENGLTQKWGGWYGAILPMGVKLANGCARARKAQATGARS